MIDALMTIMSSSGVGAITGGFFGWLGKREDRKVRAIDQEHEYRMIGAQTDSSVITSEALAFEKSQETKSSFGDFIKSAVRPVITGCLMYMTYEIMVSLDHLTGGIESFDPELAMQLYRDICLNIISLCATAVSWWFASRSSATSRLSSPVSIINHKG